MNAVLASDTDRIERTIHINAPRERVWQALSNPDKFGSWFGVNLAGQQFVPGQRARGQFTLCGHEDAFFDVVVDRIDPQQSFSFRWHPGAIDPSADYSQEEPTLVTFTLADTPDNGTLLKVVESGFDKLPPHRRMEAFRGNNAGWDFQIANIVRYVSE